MEAIMFALIRGSLFTLSGLGTLLLVGLLLQDRFVWASRLINFFSLQERIYVHARDEESLRALFKACENLDMHQRFRMLQSLMQADVSITLGMDHSSFWIQQVEILNRRSQ